MHLSECEILRRIRTKHNSDLSLRGLRCVFSLHLSWFIFGPHLLKPVYITTFFPNGPIVDDVSITAYLPALDLLSVDLECMHFEQDFGFEQPALMFLQYRTRTLGYGLGPLALLILHHSG